MARRAGGKKITHPKTMTAVLKNAIGTCNTQLSRSREVCHTGGPTRLLAESMPAQCVGEQLHVDEAELISVRSGRLI